ncbi:MAG: hypothetical protein Q9191_003247 [Dirinaria sp. TL-2023a]
MDLPLSHCIPSDAPELARIHHAVFSSPIYRVMYEHAKPEAVVEKYEKFFTDGILEQANRTDCREVHYLKITNPGTGEIMAYIVWVFLPNGYYAAEDSQTSVEGFPDGSNIPVLHEFKRVIKVVRGEDKGRKGPHFCAASKLVKWIFDRADAAQLPCYVDSSRTAHALYERLGFRDFGEMRVNLDQFQGGQGMGLQQWFAMKREPANE